MTWHLLCWITFCPESVWCETLLNHFLSWVSMVWHLLCWSTFCPESVWHDTYSVEAFLFWVSMTWHLLCWSTFCFESVWCDTYFVEALFVLSQYILHNTYFVEALFVLSQYDVTLTLLKHFCPESVWPDTYFVEALFVLSQYDTYFVEALFVLSQYDGTPTSRRTHSSHVHHGPWVQSPVVSLGTHSEQEMFLKHVCPLSKHIRKGLIIHLLALVIIYYTGSSTHQTISTYMYQDWNTSEAKRSWVIVALSVGNWHIRYQHIPTCPSFFEEA